MSTLLTSKLLKKYQGHPFHVSNGDQVFAATVRNHVRVLRSFSSWLYQEGYTEENVLARLKLPPALIGADILQDTNRPTD